MQEIIIYVIVPQTTTAAWLMCGLQTVFYNAYLCMKLHATEIDFVLSSCRRWMIQEQAKMMHNVLPAHFHTFIVLFESYSFFFLMFVSSLILPVKLYAEFLPLLSSSLPSYFLQSKSSEKSPFYLFYFILVRFCLQHQRFVTCRSN